MWRSATEKVLFTNCSQILHNSITIFSQPIHNFFSSIYKKKHHYALSKKQRVLQAKQVTVQKCNAITFLLCWRGLMINLETTHKADFWPQSTKPHTQRQLGQRLSVKNIGISLLNLLVWRIQTFKILTHCVTRAPLLYFIRS